MATPLTAAQLLSAYDRADLALHVHDGWATHNRGAHGDWGPVHGVMIHHTGDNAPDHPNTVRVLWDGRSDLPGPLCHVGIRDNATLDLISAGRANHAGLGDARVLAAVTAEDYGARPPLPRHDDTDGNTAFYGAEMMTAATPTDRQYAAAIAWAAAICHAHDWTARSVIGHKEWTARKPDPVVNMTQFRADVADRMRAL